MNPALIRVLRELYRSLYKGHEKAANNEEIWCGPLDPSTFPVETWEEFGGFYTQLQNSDFLFKSIFHLSRLLALGAFLTEAAIAEQVVSHISSGVGFDSRIEQQAKDLIYRAIGTTEPKASLGEVLAQLREYVVGINRRVDSFGNMAVQAGSNIIQK